MEPAANSSHEHRPGISGILPIKIDERECRGIGRSVARGPLDVNGTRRNVLGYGSFANWNRLPGPGASFFRGTLPVPPRRKPTHNYRATRSVASRVFPFSAESALARVTSDPRGRINSCFSTFESAPRDICRHHLLTADFFSFSKTRRLSINLETRSRGKVVWCARRDKYYLEEVIRRWMDNVIGNKLSVTSIVINESVFTN